MRRKEIQFAHLTLLVGNWRSQREKRLFFRLELDKEEYLAIWQDAAKKSDPELLVQADLIDVFPARVSKYSESPQAKALQSAKEESFKALSQGVEHRPISAWEVCHLIHRILILNRTNIEERLNMTCCSISLSQ